MLTEIISTVDETFSKIADNARKADRALAEVNKVKDSLLAADSKLEAYEAIHANLDTSVNTLSTTVSNLNKSVSDLGLEIAQIRSTADAQTGQVEANKINIDQVIAAINNFETEIEKLKNKTYLAPEG